MNQTLVSAFLKFNQQHLLFSKEKKVLLAFSGGIDSVVLAHLLKTVAQPFAIAHCNFQLRGDESQRDEKFAAAFARQYQVEFFQTKFDTAAFAANNKLSIQVAARQLRYQWFHEIIEAQHAMGNGMVLATAHHGNDNVETMLINIFRGTGIEGMHGILPNRNNLIRPLLFATKEEILNYAEVNSLQWVEDSSNDGTKYTRNFVRHEIIPATEKMFPAAVTNMMSTIEKLTEAGMLYQQAMAVHRKKLLVQNGSEWKMPVLLLQKVQPQRTVVYELIKDFGFTEGQVDEVIKLCNAESGSFTASANWRIIRHRKWLVVAPVETVQSEMVLIEKSGETTFRHGKLLIEESAGFSLEMAKRLPSAEAFVDAALLKFPFIFRPWKMGDYFYPLGMAKKKKVARFLIDQKLSKVEKEKIWVLESEKKIVWVAGCRIDDRFKLSASTKSAIKLSLE